MAGVTKSGVFTLWLVNMAPGNQYYWGEGTMWSVGNQLRDMFQKVIDHASCPFERFNYSWERGVVQQTDIVVYFLASQYDSIIKEKYKAVPKHNSGSGGTFASAGGMLSEVYLRAMEGDFDYSRLVAKLAFHECMHNKIDAAPGSSVADIHNGDGLAAATISNGTGLTDKNISLMAANLGRKVIQHTETMNATTKFLF
ncbi:MAG TPA: hypothetical protein VNB22_13550 [Pyrinomonadaceae bacterium]|nr:hypothetical protein [Pyrinomonadaceae bacterium]